MQADGVQQLRAAELGPDQGHVEDDGPLVGRRLAGSGLGDVAEAGVVLGQEAVDEVGAGAPQLLQQGVNLKLDLERVK